MSDVSKTTLSHHDHEDDASQQESSTSSSLSPSPSTDDLRHGTPASPIDDGHARVRRIMVPSINVYRSTFVWNHNGTTTAASSVHAADHFVTMTENGDAEGAM